VLSRASIAIVTEEGKSFRLQSGWAGEIFGGSFLSVAGLTRRLRSEGRHVELYILTTEHGLIKENRRIRKYEADRTILSKHEFTSKLMPEVSDLLKKNTVLVLALSSAYALSLAAAIDLVPPPQKPSDQAKVFIISGCMGTDALMSALRTYSSDITIFRKLGVVRITSRATTEIIAAV
jgi:hypothetical protein